MRYSTKRLIYNIVVRLPIAIVAAALVGIAVVAVSKSIYAQFGLEGVAISAGFLVWLVFAVFSGWGDGY